MHLYLFFSIILSLSFGTPALVLDLITYKRVKDKILLYLLISYSAYTLILYLSMFFQYIIVYNENFFYNNIKIIDNIFTFVNYTHLSTLILFVHQLFNAKLRKIGNVLLISILWLIYVLKIVMFRDVLFNQYVKSDEVPFLTFVPLVIILYFVIFGSLNFKRIIDIKDKRIAIKLIFLYSLSLLSVLIYYLGMVELYILQPVVYVVLGFIIIHHIVKYYIHCKQVKINIHSNELGKDATKILNQWSLTAREKDVLLLILEGNSNKSISEKLFISISTVKFHTKNIYLKSKLENRFELLSIFKGIK